MNLSGTATTEAVLARAEENLRTSRAAGAERLELAYEWAQLHRRSPNDRRSGWTWISLGAAGTDIYEYAAAELGISLELHPLTAQNLMADAIDLMDRLPRVWEAVQSLELEAWVGRKIARATRELDQGSAMNLDAALADALGSLPPGRLLSLVEARVIEADQAAADAKAEEASRHRFVHAGHRIDQGLRSLTARADAADVHRFAAMTDQIARILAEQSANSETVETLDQLRARAIGVLANPMLALKLLLGVGEDIAPEAVAKAIASASPAKTRPHTVLYIHATLSMLAGLGVARAEDLGPLTRARLIKLLGHEHITVKPVIDLADQLSSDRYEISDAIAERLHLLKPADVFPYAVSLSRRMDKDHSVPYRPTGPPGQTKVENLGLMTRRHHRIKTHARGWEHRQLPDGSYLWKTPHHRYRLTDQFGTHTVGPISGLTMLHGSRLEAHFANLILTA
jgi:hypothetical protein